MSVKRVYTFGNGQAEGKTEMKNLLGGKGANLAEMNLIGVPVPAGFTITTDVCIEWNEIGAEETIKLLTAEVEAGIINCEKIMGAKFGDNTNPLLLSVRSGARVSMPGMMDTVLNLGMNDDAVEGLAKKSGNERFAWDSYRRFVQMYGDVVLDMKPKTKEDIDPFEEIIEEVIEEKISKEEVAKEYPEIRLTHMYVDNAAMQLIRDPKQFDVILTGNIFGDILSDEASMISGSIGLLPSASIGGKIGLYEPIHGSAPDIADQGIANPIAAIASASMMLRFALGETRAADRIEAAIKKTLSEGYRTKDLADFDAKEVCSTGEIGSIIADFAARM